MALMIRERWKDLKHRLRKHTQLLALSNLDRSDPQATPGNAQVMA